MITALVTINVLVVLALLWMAVDRDGWCPGDPVYLRKVSP